MKELRIDPEKIKKLAEDYVEGVDILVVDGFPKEELPKIRGQIAKILVNFVSLVIEESKVEILPENVIEMDITKDVSTGTTPPPSPQSVIIKI